MSEDFDKEAERERLREKYERDKQKREATEQMSELLLQGATMTNSHCSECGDPIFRYDGQEFCPTCEKPVEGQEGVEENGDADEDNIEVRSPSEEGRVAFGSDAGAEEQAASDTQQGQPQQAKSEQEQQQRPQQAEPQTPREQPREVPGLTPETGSLESAEQSLVRTLARFSEQAEATEDPRKAKDHLAAAKEAAEALAALRR